MSSPSLALQFFGAISASHFAAFFFAGQVFGGLLLLFGRFVPLALTLLAAELYNILTVSLDDGAGKHCSGSGGFCAVVAGLPAVSRSFKGIFSAKPATQA